MEQKIIMHHRLMLYLKRKQMGVLIRQGLPFFEGANQPHFFHPERRRFIFFNINLLSLSAMALYEEEIDLSYSLTEWH